MKSILMTGATGFLGPAVAKTIAASGRHVVALTRIQSDTSGINHIPNIVTRPLELYPLGELFEEFDVDGIIHMATHYIKTHKQEDIGPMIRTNVTFPLELLNEAVSRNVRWFLNTGTGFEYLPSVTPMEDTEILDPQNLYARTKVMFDHGARFIMKDSKMSYITLLIFSPYGPGEKPFKIIPSIIRSAMNREPLTINTPDQRLDLTFSGDIAQAYLKTIELMEKREPVQVWERVSIGSGRVTKVRDLAGLIEGIVGSPAVIEYGPSSSDTHGHYPDISKASWLLGWEATTSLTDGLKITIDSARLCK